MEERFVAIPGGWFLMGSDHGHEDERPVHRVWVSPFEMAVYPVMRGQYAAFLAATSHEPPREWDRPELSRPDLPVVGVSWHDAAAYCAWRVAGGDPVRLPTEAEWECAARGGRDGERYPGGDRIPDWIPSAGRGPLQGPWPVDLGPPNAFGLHGIGANIHEWCADWHAVDYSRRSPERDPAGPAEGVRKASRGGAWRHAVTISRAAARSKIDPTFRYTDYGFRLVR
jgi:formylglycine-generating enzyme required for sulfatase activity